MVPMPAKRVLFGLFLGLFLAASIAPRAHAADRYYLEPGTDASSAVLYDMPVSLAIARCYGRYDGIVRAKTPQGSGIVAHAKSQQGVAGEELIEAAKRDRNLTFKLDTLRPGDDGPYGETVPPLDAPADLYLSYADGSDDVAAGGAGALIGSCDRLLANVKSGAGLGAAGERVFADSTTGMFDEPIVLVLANCSGMIDYLNDYWHNQAFDGDEEAAADVEALHNGVIETVKRERGIAIAPGDFLKRTLPAQIEDAWNGGYSGMDTNAPDFGDVVDQMYKFDTRPFCMKVLKDAKR